MRIMFEFEAEAKELPAIADTLERSLDRLGSDASACDSMQKDACASPMTPDEFSLRMKSLLRSGADIEVRHLEADHLLCEALRRLGYGEGVSTFEEMDKWYN